jgi:hypothetical protein
VWTFAMFRELKTAVRAPADANRVANPPNEGFGDCAKSATYGNVSLSCSERHLHDNFTSPRQDTNLAHARSPSFLCIGDRVFKRGRPREKGRGRPGCSSANLPSDAKGPNFDYFWSHVVSPMKGDRD